MAAEVHVNMRLLVMSTNSENNGQLIFQQQPIKSKVLYFQQHI